MPQGGLYPDSGEIEMVFLDPLSDDRFREFADLLAFALQDVGLRVRVALDAQFVRAHANRVRNALEPNTVDTDDLGFLNSG